MTWRHDGMLSIFFRAGLKLVSMDTDSRNAYLPILIKGNFLLWMPVLILLMLKFNLKSIKGVLTVEGIQVNFRCFRFFLNIFRILCIFLRDLEKFSKFSENHKNLHDFGISHSRENPYL